MSIGTEVVRRALEPEETPSVVRRVTAAIDALVAEYVDLLDEYGGLKMIGDAQVYDAADARRALYAIVNRELNQTP